VLFDVLTQVFLSLILRGARNRQRRSDSGKTEVR